jgi:hypothetical protein
MRKVFQAIDSDFAETRSVARKGIGRATAQVFSQQGGAE